MRPVFQWNWGALELGKRTLIMGIVNVTPDSFSDGGKFLDRDQAIAHAERLLVEGADILDIGGESTRPGARVDAGGQTVSQEKRRHRCCRESAHVSAEEELKRVLPVIGELKKKHRGAVLSVDTYKAAVGARTVGAGAEIVNDVSGFRWDALMAKTVAASKCGVVLMHARASRGMAHAAAARRHRVAGKNANSRSGRRKLCWPECGANVDRARSRLWLWQEF